MQSSRKKKKEFESPYAQHKKGLRRDDAVIATVVAGALMTIVYYLMIYGIDKHGGKILTGPASRLILLYLVPPVILAIGTISLYKYFRAR